jgi:hypothetical protein
MIIRREIPSKYKSRTMTSGFICNINGIPPQRSARYGWLVEALLRAIEERRELPDGSVE